MIRIGLVSDLHSEFWVFDHHAAIAQTVQRRLADADLILLPGDIGLAEKAVERAVDLFPRRPVVMVAGNHEFYNDEYHRVCGAMQEAARAATAAGHPIHVLNREVLELTINDRRLRIIGTTLWTDFALNSSVHLDLAMLDAERRLNDFRLISFRGRALTPKDTLLWHMSERSWLMQMIDTPFDGTTIVMTHHAPVSFAISDRYVGDALSPCFASHLEEQLVRPDVALVVWGHTHHCVDRAIDKTRFVSNQTGYPSSMLGCETGQYGQVITL